MGFISENLMEGEKIIYETKLHKIIFLPVILFFVMFTISTFAPNETGVGEKIFFFIIFILPIFTTWGIIVFLRYKMSEFVITDKRVLIKTGILTRNTFEILLKKIEGIQVHQGIFGKDYNWGKVIITGTGGGKNIFKNIDSPIEFRAQAQRQISVAQEDESTPITPKSNNLDDLERLASLFEKGLITQDEFNVKKQQILGL